MNVGGRSQQSCWKNYLVSIRVNLARPIAKKFEWMDNPQQEVGCGKVIAGPEAFLHAPVKTLY